MHPLEQHYNQHGTTHIYAAAVGIIGSIVKDKCRDSEKVSRITETLEVLEKLKKEGK